MAVLKISHGSGTRRAAARFQ